MGGLYFSTFLCLGVLVRFLNSPAEAGDVTCSGIVPMKDRTDRISIADYGGVGDGVTLNTNAFREAIYRIEHLNRNGGTVLHIPAGEYLTGPFNLTSHMTLYLAAGAVIKATSDIKQWTLVEPLPSYGRGRERPGGRYMSFLHGDGLQDVIITGENGTIEGQGNVWWDMWRQRTLQFTRPSLLELMNSKSILVSNVTFKNSPFWNIHPVYCSDVVINYVTILAPADSPNTDGIDPDSSSNVCIEDSYISTGDDLIAVKSGWDEYGISYNRPSSNIAIRRVTGSSPFAGFAVGSETSGGIQNILAEHMHLFNMGVGIHLKTNAGRGGVIRNITVSDVSIVKARKGIKMAGDVGDHADDKYDRNALPVMRDVVIRNVWGEGVLQAGLIRGLKGSSFKGICFYNVSLGGSGGGRDLPWVCEDVMGWAVEVSPRVCSEMTSSEEEGVCSSASLSM